MYLHENITQFSFLLLQDYSEHIIGLFAHRCRSQFHCQHNSWWHPLSMTQGVSQVSCIWYPMPEMSPQDSLCFSLMLVLWECFPLSSWNPSLGWKLIPSCASSAAILASALVCFTTGLMPFVHTVLPPASAALLPWNSRLPWGTSCTLFSPWRPPL